jgi:hypothetical protein
MLLKGKRRIIPYFFILFFQSLGKRTFSEPCRRKKRDASVNGNKYQRSQKNQKNDKSQKANTP